MMGNNIFISHSVEDSEIARLVSSTLKMLSLKQIHTWYSSSDNYGEGFTPGDIWFTRICDEILKSKALIVILTPNSISRPWIYFESGIAKGCPNNRVIPLCIGISKDEIKPPLSNFQLFQLSDYDSAKSFLEFLFKTLDIEFCETISKEQIRELVSETAVVLKNNTINQTEKDYSIESILEDIRYHIDKRFIEISNMGYKHIGNKGDFSYTINIENQIGKVAEKQFIEIKASDSVQNVLDRIFFLLDGAVEAYTYMQPWILQNKHSKANMVMYEITDSISAMQVFKPNSTWQILRLARPYTAKKSKHYRGLGLKFNRK